MTNQEELLYLTDILLEGSRWTRDADEPLSGCELEIRDRIRRLSGVNTMDDNGRVQGNLADVKPMKDYSHPNRVRVSLPGGKKKWVTPDKVKKVPYARSKTGYRYVLKEEEDVAQN